MRWLCLLGALLLALDASSAEACSTCTVGDPTLTALGVGQPYRNRLRFSFAARQRRETVGAVDQLSILEHRFELGAAWAPADRWMISAVLPLVHQRVIFPNLARQRRFTIGDAELRVRAVLFRDRSLAPRHLLSGIVGLELPTAPVVRDRTGQASFDLQLGSGSFDPLVGVLYSRFAAPHSAHVMVSALFPTPGRFGVRGGTSGRVMSRYQWQPRSVGLELGVDARIDGMDRLASVADRDSGGFVLWLSGGLIAQVVSGVIVRGIVSFPVIQSLRGGHEEGVALLAAVTLDV